MVYFEKGDVNKGRIKVDKLEDEDFESETVFVFGLSSGVFEVGHPASDAVVDASEYHDDDQVDERSSHQSEDLRVFL